MTWFLYHPLGPEQRLWATVLEQAGRDWWSNDVKTRREARDWVLYSGGRVAGFAWACLMVDIDPRMLLAAIERKSQWLFDGTLGQKTLTKARETPINYRRSKFRLPV